MRQKKDVVLVYFAMMLVKKQEKSFNICRYSRSVPCGVTGLPRLRGYNLSLLLCGRTALPRYAAIISYVTA